MLPITSIKHSAHRNFVVTHLSKYYPNPDFIYCTNWNIIDRFWNLALSYTDTAMVKKYSIFGPKPRAPTCMQRSYMLSIVFLITSVTELVSNFKINRLFAIFNGLKLMILLALALSMTSFVGCWILMTSISVHIFTN